MRSVLWCLWHYFNSDIYTIWKSAFVHGAKAAFTKDCREIVGDGNNFLKCEAIGNVCSFQYFCVAYICEAIVLYQSS